MGGEVKIQEAEESWDSRELGASEEHVRVTPQESAAKIDDSLGLQMISIRLEKTLIETFKIIAEYHGIGYQPLMRDALKRFADGEMRAIVSGLVESQRKQKNQEKYTAQEKTKKAA